MLKTYKCAYDFVFKCGKLVQQLRVLANSQNLETT